MSVTSTRARRAAVIGVAFVLLGSTALAAVPAASADPGKSIEQVQAEVRALEDRAESAAEQYAQAEDKLSQIAADTQDAQKQVDQARKDVKASQEVIGAIAATAYQTGGMDASMQLLLAEDPQEFLSQAAALDQVASNQSTALRRAATANLRLAQATARLEAKQNEQQQTVDEAAAHKSEIDQAVQDKQAYLDQLQEEERQRLAELAAAEAAASAAAAAQAAAQLDDNGGGSGAATGGPSDNSGGAGDAAGTGPSDNSGGAGDAAGTGPSDNSGGAGDGDASGGPSDNNGGNGGGSGGGDYSSRAAIAVRAALAQVGEPYTYNAHPPNSWDCSKLTAWAWAQAGVSLTAYSYAQANQVRRIPTSALQPGDILFYFRGAHHVAMYIGGGQIVEASSPSTGVRVTSAWNSWSSSHFSFAGRPY